jgi:hypothetical protein
MNWNRGPGPAEGYRLVRSGYMGWQFYRKKVEVYRAVWSSVIQEARQEPLA